MGKQRGKKVQGLPGVERKVHREHLPVLILENQIRLSTWVYQDAVDWALQKCIPSQFWRVEVQEPGIGTGIGTSVPQPSALPADDHTLLIRHVILWYPSLSEFPALRKVPVDLDWGPPMAMFVLSTTFHYYDY